MKSACLTAFALAILAVPRPASAEIVVFSTGRTLSVKAHRVDGDSLVLTLRSGSEIVCQGSLVTEIAPDEAPYPEPESAPAPAVVQTAANPAPYAEIIDKVAAEQGVDARLVHALIRVESGYNERARSRKGAMGLMQLMPETARRYGVADPYDPRANVEAGIRHLKSLLERFPRELALAAYNAGEAAVQRFRGVPPYRETRDYVKQILGLLG